MDATAEDVDKSVSVEKPVLVALEVEIVLTSEDDVEVVVEVVSVVMTVD